MKKLKEYKTEHLKNVVLYLDDLENIVKVFNEVSDDVEITIGEYILDRLSEIENLKEEAFNSLNVRIPSPHISLDIDREKVFLGEFEGTLETRGLFERVKQILCKRKRKLSWFFQSSWIGYTSMLLLILGINLAEKLDNFFLRLVSLIFFILTLIWFGGMARLVNKNKIFPKRRSELPSFWKRKKDEIIVAIITAIISVIGTVIVIKLFK